MGENYRGLAAIQSHIQAYWLKTEGVDQPLYLDPKNEFLGKFDAKIALMIETVDTVRRDAFDAKKYFPSPTYPAPEEADLPAVKLNQYIRESLKTLHSELQAIKNIYSADKPFCDLMNLLQQDIDGASKQLEKKPSYNIMKTYAEFLGGFVIDETTQNMFPFIGSIIKNDHEDELLDDEGMCLGILDSAANEKNFDTREIFIRQNDDSKHLINKKVLLRSQMSVEDLFKTNPNLKWETHYSMLMLEGAGAIAHVISIRECNGIKEFEISDPNKGTFRLPNKESMIKFLKFLFIDYEVFDEFTLCYLGQLPIENQNTLPKQDVTLCQHNSYTLNEDTILRNFIKIDTIINAQISSSHSKSRDIKTVQYLKSITEMVKQSRNTKYVLYTDLLERLCETQNYTTAQTLCGVVISLIIRNPEKAQKKRCSDFIDEIITSEKDAMYHPNEFTQKIVQRVLGKYESKAFDKMSIKEKINILKIMLHIEYDFNKLVEIFKKHDTYIGLNFQRWSPENYTKILNTLYACEPLALYNIHNRIGPTRDNTFSAVRLYGVMSDMHKEKEIILNKDYYNPDFFKTMMQISEKSPNQTSHEIFYKTIIEVETNKVNVILKGEKPFRRDEFLSLINKILDTPWRSEALTNEYQFIKKLMTVTEKESQENIKLFIENNMPLFLTNFDKCQKISFLCRHDDVIKQVAQHMANHLTDVLNCKCMLELHHQPRYRLMAIEVTAEATLTGQNIVLTAENRQYLTPILLDPKMIEEMDQESFNTLLENLVQCDATDSNDQTSFFPFFNDTALNSKFIHELPADKIILLFKFLTKADETGHSLAESFQYPVRKVENQTELRWTQIINHLREAFDRQITDPEDAALLKSGVLVREPEHHLHLGRN